MSAFPDLTADLRARASYLSPCPLCSVLGVADAPELIRGPVAIQRRTDGRHGLIRCCPLSSDAPWFDTAAEAAQWWTAKRQQPLPCVASDNRRRNVLAKLAAAGKEALT